MGHEPIGLTQEGFLLKIEAVPAARGWSSPTGEDTGMGKMCGTSTQIFPGGGVFEEARRVPRREVAANLSPGQRAQTQGWRCHCVCPNFSLGTITTPPQARCQKLQLEVGRHLPSLAACRFPTHATPKEGGGFHNYAGIGHFYTENRKVKVISD